MHRLDDLFRDEQRRIIGIALEERLADYERSFALLANQDEEVLSRLGQLNYPIPKPLRAAASTFIDLHLADEVNRLARGESASLDAIDLLHERGQGWGYERERGRLERTLADALARTLEEIRPDADLDGIVARKLLLAAATRLGVAPDLWQVQNRFLNAVGELFEARVDGRSAGPRARIACRGLEDRPQPARLATMSLCLKEPRRQDVKKKSGERILRWSTFSTE